MKISTLGFDAAWRVEELEKDCGQEVESTAPKTIPAPASAKFKFECGLGPYRPGSAIPLAGFASSDLNSAA